MDTTTLIATFLPLAVATYWLIGLIKDGSNGNINGLLTRLVSFFGAFVLINLAAHTTMLGDRAAGGLLFKRLGWADLAVGAMFLASGAGLVSDFFRTINRADTSVALTLIPAAAPVPLGAPVMQVWPVIPEGFRKSWEDVEDPVPEPEPEPVLTESERREIEARQELADLESRLTAMVSTVSSLATKFTPPTEA